MSSGVLKSLVTLRSMSEGANAYLMRSIDFGNVLTKLTYCPVPPANSNLIVLHRSAIYCVISLSDS